MRKLKDVPDGQIFKISTSKNATSYKMISKDEKAKTATYTSTSSERSFTRRWHQLVLSMLFIFFCGSSFSQVTVVFPTIDSFNRAMNKPPTVLKGEKGDAGKDGIGINGKDGRDGTNGKDGISVKGEKGDKGDKGDTGPAGRDGKDGIITSGGGTTSIQLFSIKSVIEFGAIPNDGVDDYKSIQEGIDYCLKNNIRTLFFPLGNYNLSHALIVFRPNQFSTLELLGETSFWESIQGSKLIADFTNSFVIGLQNNKGSKIRKLFIQGKFQPPSSSDRNKFFNLKFEEFTDGICRDTRVSPYAAIVIDPFTNLPDQMTEAGAYPGLSSYYGASPGFSSQTGSTGTEIEEMIINNFVVGILSSPNGTTRNAEITIINKIQFENCKLCLGTCQAQEKGNVISNIYCWGGTHTIFGVELYGAYGSGNWHVDHVNIAGAVVRFVYNNQSEWFSNSFSHVFAESLGYWGTLNSGIAASVNDCEINFEFDDATGNPRYQGPLIVSHGANVVYRSCNFRMYDGKAHTYEVEGDAYFDHCYWYNGTFIRK